ncbi:hypothetical protein B0H16DRAFT_1454589 [Mycena metata]|uniref:Uncharacterized protein n=1 Tax=Mycena metata TaxID=1033252 RepID=A0AAD7NJP6_9AGAR|nr:hypothetical protein B0H16DRAFT_1454589 [Mycena metata]
MAPSKRPQIFKLLYLKAAERRATIQSAIAFAHRTARTRAPIRFKAETDHPASPKIWKRHEDCRRLVTPVHSSIQSSPWAELLVYWALDFHVGEALMQTLDTAGQMEAEGKLAATDQDTSSLTDEFGSLHFLVAKKNNPHCSVAPGLPPSAVHALIEDSNSFPFDSRQKIDDPQFGTARAGGALLGEAVIQCWVHAVVKCCVAGSRMSTNSASGARIYWGLSEAIRPVEEIPSYGSGMLKTIERPVGQARDYITVLGRTRTPTRQSLVSLTVEPCTHRDLPLFNLTTEVLAQGCTRPRVLVGGLTLHGRRAFKSSALFGEENQCVSDTRISSGSPKIEHSPGIWPVSDEPENHPGAFSVFGKFPPSDDTSLDVCVLHAVRIIRRSRFSVELWKTRNKRKSNRLEEAANLKDGERLWPKSSPSRGAQYQYAVSGWR